jgi:hypothetical protein
MSKIAPQVFKDITDEQWTKLVAKAKAGGIDLNGNTGTASKFGVDVAWNYVPGTQELTFQCLSTPFFVKPQDVYAKIQALVKETVASDRNA